MSDQFEIEEDDDDHEYYEDDGVEPAYCDECGTFYVDKAHCWHSRCKNDYEHCPNTNCGNSPHVGEDWI